MDSLAHNNNSLRRKVIILLEELGLPYNLELVEFSDVKKPEYLNVNPNGRLPTIEDPNTGIVLWEVSESMNQPFHRDRRADRELVDRVLRSFPI
jgi:glutathione S-transferase